jgi:hypothetical protein
MAIPAAAPIALPTPTARHPIAAIRPSTSQRSAATYTNCGQSVQSPTAKTWGALVRRDQESVGTHLTTIGGEHELPAHQRLAFSLEEIAGLLRLEDGTTATRRASWPIRSSTTCDRSSSTVGAPDVGAS